MPTRTAEELQTALSSGKISKEFDNTIPRSSSAFGRIGPMHTHYRSHLGLPAKVGRLKIRQSARIATTPEAHHEQENELEHMGLRYQRRISRGLTKLQAKEEGVEAQRLQKVT